MVGEVGGGFFGKSVSISADGKIIAIGAPYPGIDLGSVMVYGWNEATLDFQQRGQTINGCDYFGYSVSLSGSRDTLAIGSPKDNEHGDQSGRIIIYEWDETVLDYQARSQSLYGEAGDELGRSVVLSADGKSLAVGAEFEYAKVYQFDAATLKYIQIGQTFTPDATSDFNFWGSPISLSADGSTLAIGAPFNDESSVGSGQVKVYEWDPVNSNYTKLGNSIIGSGSDLMGQSVALSRDGKTLVVGSRGNGDNGSNSGHVRVFSSDDNNF